MTRGLTLVEVLVAAALLACVGGLVGDLMFQARSRLGSAAGQEAAVRSALSALERIESDLDRLWLQNPEEDLVLLSGGGAVRFRVPEALGADLWLSRLTHVEYRLKEDHLVRIAGGSRQVLSGSLAGLSFDYLARGALGREHFLQVTAVGAAPDGPDRYTASRLIPLGDRLPPEPYLLPGADQ